MNTKNFSFFAMMSINTTVTPILWWKMDWLIHHYEISQFNKYISEWQIISAALLILTIELHTRHNNRWTQCSIWAASLIGCICALLSFYLWSHPFLEKGTPVSNLHICLSVLIAGCVLWSLVYISRIVKPQVTVYPPPSAEQLGRTYSYNSLIRHIREQASSEHLNTSKQGCTMAILGEWGSGKSHCLQYIKHKLSQHKDSGTPNKPKASTPPTSQFQESTSVQNKASYEGDFLICEVSLWKCKSVDDAWLNIVNALNQTIHGRETSGLSALPGKWLSLLLKIASACSIKKAATLDAILEIVLSSTDVNIQSKAEEVDKALAEKRALLILDDVERAEFEILSRLFPLIDQLRSITKLTVICSISEDELEAIFKKRGEGFEQMYGYMAKVFDYTHKMPVMSVSMMKNKLIGEVEQSGVHYIFLKEFVQNETLVFDSPRQMERLVNRWKAIERQYFSLPDTTPPEVQGKVTRAYRNKVHLIFYIEALRIYGKKVFDALDKANNAIEFVQQKIIKVASSDGRYKNLEKFYDSQKNEYTGLIVRSALTFLCQHSSRISNVDLAYARDLEYAKIKELNDFQCEAIILNSYDKNHTSLREDISHTFGNTGPEDDCVEKATSRLLKYSVEHIHQGESYQRYALSIVEKLDDYIIHKFNDYIAENTIGENLCRNLIKSIKTHVEEDKKVSQNILKKLINILDAVGVTKALQIAYDEFNEDKLSEVSVLFFTREERIVDFKCKNEDYKIIIEQMYSIYANKLIESFRTYDKKSDIDKFAYMLGALHPINFPHSQPFGEVVCKSIARAFLEEKGREEAISGILHFIRRSILTLETNPTKRTVLLLSLQLVLIPAGHTILTISRSNCDKASTYHSELQEILKTLRRKFAVLHITSDSHPFSMEVIAQHLEEIQNKIKACINDFACRTQGLAAHALLTRNIHKNRRHKK